MKLFSTITRLAVAISILVISGMLWLAAGNLAERDTDRWAVFRAADLTRNALATPSNIEIDTAAAPPRSKEQLVAAEIGQLLGDAGDWMLRSPENAGADVMLGPLTLERRGEAGLWAARGEFDRPSRADQGPEAYFAIIDQVCESRVLDECWRLIEFDTGSQAVARNAVTAQPDEAAGQDLRDFLARQEAPANLSEMSDEAGHADLAENSQAPGATDGEEVEQVASLTAEPHIAPVPASRATVAQIQIGLRALGYDVGPDDGLVGPRTEQAIRTYQAERSLDVNGIPTAEILAHIALERSRGLADSERTFVETPDAAASENVAAGAAHDSWEIAVPVPPTEGQSNLRASGETPAPSPLDEAAELTAEESGGAVPSAAQTAAAQQEAESDRGAEAPADVASAPEEEVSPDVDRPNWLDRVTIVLGEEELGLDEVATQDSADVREESRGPQMTEVPEQTAPDTSSESTPLSQQAKAALESAEQALRQQAAETEASEARATEVLGGADSVAEASNDETPPEGAGNASEQVAVAETQAGSIVADSEGRVPGAAASEEADATTAADEPLGDADTPPGTAEQRVAEEAPELAYADTQEALTAPVREEETPVETVKGDGNLPAENLAEESEPKKVYDRTLVRQIQLALNSLGYQPGPTDGWMGPRTERAIAAYQREQELTIDGEPSVALFAHIALERTKAIATAAPSVVPSAPAPVVAAEQALPPDDEPKVAEVAGIEPNPEIVAATTPPGTTVRYFLELDRYDTQQRAIQAAARTRAEFAPLLGTAAPEVDTLNLGASGSVYQVRFGPVAERTAADVICSQLRARSNPCLVVRTVGQAPVIGDYSELVVAGRGSEQPLPNSDQDGVAYATAAVDMQKKGIPGRAIELYSLAVDAGDLSQESLAYVYNNRGAAYKAIGFIDLAIEDYERAARLKNDYSRAYYNRAIAYYSKGLVEQAIADYSRAIELENDFTEAYHNRGHAHARQRQFDQAIADYTAAIEQVPAYDSAYFNRGRAYEAMGALDRALSDYRQAYALDQDNPAYLAKIREITARGEVALQGTDG